MKRMHVLLNVKDLRESVTFYSALFGAAPTVVKDDYAKWLLDDPRVNFSIAQGPGGAGVRHLGIQAESEAELRQVYAGIQRAGAAREEGHTACCYAQSEKAWVTDPQGVEWEAFHTYDQSPTYLAEEASACCADTCCGETAETLEAGGTVPA